MDQNGAKQRIYQAKLGGLKGLILLHHKAKEES
jgi:hypothetical protein